EYWGGIARKGNAYTAQIRLLKNGAWTTLASVPIVAPSGRATLKFDVVGTSLELSINGNLIVSAANASIIAGGVTGSYGDAGSAVWPAQATAVNRPLTTLPFADSFTQPD